MLPFASSDYISIHLGSVKLTSFLENLFATLRIIRKWEFTAIRNREKIWTWDIIQTFLMKLQRYSWSTERPDAEHAR